jgi:hypothetical protein
MASHRAVGFGESNLRDATSEYWSCAPGFPYRKLFRIFATLARECMAQRLTATPYGPPSSRGWAFTASTRGPRSSWPATPPRGMTLKHPQDFSILDLWAETAKLLPIRAEGTREEA